MPDTWITPRIWVAGEKYTASKANDISNNFRSLFPYTAGGALAYRDPAGAYLSELAAPAGLSLFQHDGSVPSYFPMGTAYQCLRVNAAGDQFEFGNTPVTLLTGNGDQMVSAGNPVLWATEIFDDGGWHSVVSNTGRITAPADGRYRVAAILGLWTAGGGGVTQFQASLRASTAPIYYNRKAVISDTQMYTMEFPSFPMLLLAGDYIEIYYDSGGIINMEFSYLSMERVL